MSADLAALVAARFRDFAAPYLDAPGDAFAYRLKLNHTMRVLGLAETICAGEGFSERLTLAGRLAALLHDVGRFPQYEMFRTFRDAQSANHALLSVRHALRARLLEGVPNDIRRIVLGAVYLHNKRTMPPLRNHEIDAVARLVRDSDKLDIFKIMIDHFSAPPQEHPEVTLHVKDDPARFTPAVLETVMRRLPGDYRDLVYVNDFKIMMIGWLYDLNYATAFRLLAQSGHLEAMFASLPADADIARLREQISTDLAERAGRA